MPFVKGDPNINRNGRPKKALSMTTILNGVLEEETINFNGNKISGKQAVARKMLELAMSGDVQALKYLYDRIDGTPTQTVDQTVKTEIVNVGIPDFEDQEADDS